MGDVRDYLTEIYPRIQAQSDVAFPEFGFKRKGNGWEATEGQIDGDEAKGHLYHYDNTPFCFKNQKTGETVSLWDYVQRENGLDNQGTLKELAQLANYSLPGLDPRQADRIRQKQERENILEEAQTFFVASLWSEAGQEARDYLEGRGYSEEEIQAWGLGFYPSEAELIEHLVSRDYTVNQVNKEGLVTKSYGDTHKLTIPSRDPVGRIKGFIVRTLEEGVEPKYLLSRGTDRSTLFNLHEARGRDVLVVVEGFLDALVSTSRGITGVVATGGLGLTETQVNNAMRYRVKRVILALDNDDRGQEGTGRSLDLLYRKGLRPFVAILPEGYKDPDELITKKGPEAFEEIVNNPISGARWRVYNLEGQYDLTNDLEKDEFFDKAISFEEKIRDSLDSKDFTDTLSEVSGVPIELLEPRIKDYHEKKAGERYERDLQSFSRSIQTGELKNPRDLEKRARDIRLDFERDRIRPSTPLSVRLREKRKRDSERKPGDLLGYGLKRFKRIAERTDGIQPGFYFLGAYTNIGKTAFLTNLFLDLLGANPETQGLYFSLDDSRDVIINRLLGIMTRLDLNRVAREQDNKIDRRKIEKAYEELTRLAENGRLEIKDHAEVNHIDALEVAVREKANEAENLFVFIDAVYDLDVEAEAGGIREQNILRATRVKGLVTDYGIPVIASGELRKPIGQSGDNKRPTLHDIMETGKYAYKGDLVWLLYPENTEEYREKDEPILKLDFNKNKLSHYTGYLSLRFLKSRGVIEDTEGYRG